MEQLKELLFQLYSAAGTPGDEQFAQQAGSKSIGAICCTDVTMS